MGEPAHPTLDTYYLGACTQADHPELLHRKEINTSGHLTYSRHLFWDKMKSSYFFPLTIKATFHSILPPPAQMNPIQDVSCTRSCGSDHPVCSGSGCFRSQVSTGSTCLPNKAKTRLLVHSPKHWHLMDQITYQEGPSQVWCHHTGCPQF